MNGLQTTVTLGAVVLVGSVLAPRLRVATPLLLLLLGLGLGSFPQLRAIELPPETVLLLFLPVMLFWESLTTSLRSIRRDFRGILIMSTLLVVATAFAVAATAHALGLPWGAALVLGAALAPPDATAVAALGRTLPHRNFMVLKAESLTNDGTALVIYAIAVGIAVGGHYSALDVTGLIALSYLGGIAAGALVAGLAHLVLRRLRDATTINTGLLLIPFAAYLLAETVGASGVLAVVVSGLAVAFDSARISTAASRRQTESTWPLGSAVLNGALFVLIGLEVQTVTRQLAATELARLLVVVVAVWLVLLLVRFAFQTASVSLIRVLDRRPSQRGRRMSYRARVVSSVAGFRGAISLAIALSVPQTTGSGQPFPGRDEIVVVTAGVIVLTLFVQGPLLPAVVRWARLPADTAIDEELRLAEHAVVTAALTAIDEVAAEHGTSDEVRDRLAREHRERWPRERPGPDERTRLRMALLDREREVLVRLRREGTIDDSVARRVQTRLDLEELHLTGVESLD